METTKDGQTVHQRQRSGPLLSGSFVLQCCGDCWSSKIVATALTRRDGCKGCLCLTSCSLSAIHSLVPASQLPCTCGCVGFTLCGRLIVSILSRLCRTHCCLVVHQTVPVHVGVWSTAAAIVVWNTWEGAQNQVSHRWMEEHALASPSEGLMEVSKKCVALQKREGRVVERRKLTWSCRDGRAGQDGSPRRRR